MSLWKARTLAAIACYLVAACSEVPRTENSDNADAQKEASALAAKDTADAAREDEGTAIGAEAVIYGLPLVIMDMTGRVATNVSRSQPDGHAPLNQFGHMTTLPTAANRYAANLNVDTLYSWGWLDLSKEPIVMSMPDTAGRYYLVSMVDAWTNVFASLGKRTTGTKARSFAITGPNWKGKLPAGLTEFKSPTSTICIIVRMQTSGRTDYEVVRAMQKGYRLTPLSAFGKPFTPPVGAVDQNVDVQMSPVEQVIHMSAATFLKTLATLMKANPPALADAAAMATFAQIGLVPGHDFDTDILDPAIARGLEKSVPAALQQLQAEPKDLGSIDNGWNLSPAVVGDYGTHYGARAVNAMKGLGSNLPADVVYPNAVVDGEGKPLDGANRYVLHFGKGQTPPANGFWSLTMYDADGAFVDNALNRYSIAGWMPLKYNRDGSLDVYLQRASPGKEKDANWLPAAAGAFNVTLRIYWPKPAVLDRTWHPPPIARTK